MSKEEGVCAVRFDEALAVALAGRAYAVGMWDPIRYDKTDPNVHVTPDFAMFLDYVPPAMDQLRTWNPGWRPPALVVEHASKSTVVRDQSEKPGIYASLGVAEYFLFDPHYDTPRRRVLPVALLGFALDRSGECRLISPVAGRWPSRVLGLDLVPVGEMLRLYDPAAGKLVPLEAEREAERAEREAERAEREAERAERAEAEITRLRAELEARRSGGG